MERGPRLTDTMTLAEGALLEPLSVVLQGLRVAGLTLGRGAVVCGAGPIGLTAVLAARASGAHPLVVTDVEPGRLAFARQLVPSCLTYRVDPALDARANARGIRKLFGARGGGGEGEGGDEGAEYLAPPCVLECTGVESSVCTAAFTVRRGGRVVVVGVGKDTMNNLPFMHLSLSEVCDTDEPPPLGATSYLQDPPFVFSHEFIIADCSFLCRSMSASSIGIPTPGQRAFHV